MEKQINQAESKNKELFDAIEQLKKLSVLMKKKDEQNANLKQNLNEIVDKKFLEKMQKIT